MKSYLLTVVAVLLVAAASSANASVTLLGNPYTPQGANYSIYAVQNIDLTNGTGNGNPQVNLGFEFDDGIGVSYSQANGSLRNFGLGLYNSGGLQSTALRIQYQSLVDPSQISVRLEDFDISANATFFKPGKVEPGVLLLGNNGNIITNALPTDIWTALSNVPGGQHGDVWDLSFARLFRNLNLQNQAISGFILYADRTAGEQANSDPYFLVSLGNGIPLIPEPSTYVAGFAALAFALLHVRNARKRRAIATR